MGDDEDLEDLVRLVEKHKGLTTDREKTQCENEMWVLAKTAKLRNIDRAKWLRGQIGYPGNYQHRTTLKDAPPALWDYAESKGLKLPKCVLLYKEALNVRDIQHCSTLDALQLVITQKESVVPKKEPVPKKVPDVAVVQEGWAELQQAIEKCLIPVLAEMTAAQKIRYIPRLNRGIQQAIAALYASLKRDADEENSMPVSISELKAACDCLHVDMPEHNMLVDLEMAKRNKRTLIYDVHPDQSATPNLVVFQEYINAYDTLAKYNDQIRENTAEPKEETHAEGNSD